MVSLKNKKKLTEMKNNPIDVDIGIALRSKSNKMQ